MTANVSNKSRRSRSRTRSKRVSPIEDWHETDSEEDQSTWIADDICTHCGGLAPHRKLYCSRRCRDADAATNDSKVYVDHEQQASEAAALSESLKKLRYPVNFSPTTQYIKVAQQPGLAKHTSRPALASYRQGSNLSSEEGSELGHGLAHLRNGSRSSVSTTSDVADTDFTTPSPWHLAVDTENDDDINGLDDAELSLPPPLCAANHVLLRKGGSNTVDAGVVSRPNNGRTPSPMLYPHSYTAGRPLGSNIQFNRMPGTTNLPTPVLFNSGHSQPQSKNSFTMLHKPLEPVMNKNREPEEYRSTVSIYALRRSLKMAQNSVANEVPHHRRLSSLQYPEMDAPNGAWKQSICKAHTETSYTKAKRALSQGFDLCDCRKGVSAGSSHSKASAETLSNNRTVNGTPETMDTPVRGRALRRGSCDHYRGRSTGGSGGVCSIACINAYESHPCRRKSRESPGEVRGNRYNAINVAMLDF